MIIVYKGVFANLRLNDNFGNDYGNSLAGSNNLVSIDKMKISKFN